MLKFALKKDCLDFMRGWITSDYDMYEEERGEELLGSLFDEASGVDMDAVLEHLRKVKAMMKIDRKFHVTYALVVSLTCHIYLVVCRSQTPVMNCFYHTL